MNQTSENPKNEPVMDFRRAAKQSKGLERIAELRDRFGLKKEPPDAR